MTDRQINLIQTSFREVALQSNHAATIFYNRLFAIKPALRLLFPTDLTEQKKKLTTMLAVAVNSLREPARLVPVLENLGRKHALYGVRDEHYDTVGAALLWTLDEMLGAAFDQETEIAWAEMYGFVAATMRRAARELAAESEDQKIYLQETRKMPKTPTLIGQTALLILTVLTMGFGAFAQTAEALLVVSLQFAASEAEAQQPKRIETAAQRTSSRALDAKPGTVTIYVIKHEKDPSGADSYELIPLERKIGDGESAPRAALEMLFSDQFTKLEKSLGIMSPTHGLKLESVEMSDGAITILYSQLVVRADNAFADPVMFVRAVKNTAQQFAEIKRIEICSIGEMVLDKKGKPSFLMCLLSVKPEGAK